MKFLGLDIGTSGSRAVVIDENGKSVIAATATHKDFAATEIGWAEQNPSDWWRACRKAIGQVLQTVKAEEVAAQTRHGHGEVSGVVSPDGVRRTDSVAVDRCG